METIASKKILVLLSDFKQLRKKILLIDDKEESFNHKLEIILAYYYYTYKRRLFVEFISSKNERNEEVRSNLKKNRKIFNDFKSEILNFEIMNEAKNIDEIQSLLFLVPNLIELIKIFSVDKFYDKFNQNVKAERKICSFTKVIMPNEEDNIELLKTNFFILSKLVKLKRNLLFIIREDFFEKYCEFFYLKDLKKIELILDIYKEYNTFQSFVTDEKKKKNLKKSYLIIILKLVYI